MHTDDKKRLKHWQDTWPQAVELWSKHTRIRYPTLCQSHVEAADFGLSESFAMIRLHDQLIVVDLERTKKLNLDEDALAVLAHEIGHHVLAPANLTEHALIIAKVRRALPTLEKLAPMVANLYTDLLINDYLKRQAGLALERIYQKINLRHISDAKTQYKRSNQSRPKNNSLLVWQIYMRIYEVLWQLDANELGSGTLTDAQEGDAWLGSRIIKVYARDQLIGADRFASLLLPYLVEENDEAETPEILAPLMDTAQAGSGQVPSGLILGDDSVCVHPSADPLVTGSDLSDEEVLALDPELLQSNGLGQYREPFEYGEILNAAGLSLNPHEISIRYYKERALPYLMAYPTVPTEASSEQIPEGLTTWNIGESMETIDWFQTVATSPVIVPGVTTMRREYGSDSETSLSLNPVDLDLYVDCSGSMPNPQIQTSYITLAGAVLALSALRAGASVQVTLWSGKNEFDTTQGFVRSEQQVLEILCGYLGGATAFPIHVMRETHAEKRAHPCLVAILSDDGVTTLFDQDEKGNSGWDVARTALANSAMSGLMILNLHWAFPQTPQNKYLLKIHEDLIRAQQIEGWHIAAVSSLEEMLSFSRTFSEKYCRRD